MESSTLFTKPASTDHDIHDLLKHRWSPRAFEDRPVSEADLLSLFEAARWTPSANNSQPWSFVVATREDSEGFERVAGLLNERNARWARKSPVLVVTVVKTQFDAEKPNPWAAYDAGQAIAHLSIQAQSLGLSVHQMAGFDAAKAPEALGIPEGYAAVTVFAVGYQGDPEELPEDLKERELSSRQRKPLSSFVFRGRWEQPAG